MSCNLQVSTYPTPQLRAECDTRSIFKGKDSLNSVSLLLDWLRYQGQRIPSILFTHNWEKQIHAFPKGINTSEMQIDSRPSREALVQSEMQTDWFMPFSKAIISKWEVNA